MNMFKTSPAITPEEYISLITDPSRQADIQTLFELIQQTLPKEKPFMLAGMIAFVPYHYTYASGREGDWAVIGLASQKNYISLYACAAKDGKYVAEENKDRLPKANIGKSCIRFKKVSDIDLKVLKEIIKESVEVAKTHGFAM